MSEPTTEPSWIPPVFVVVCFGVGLLLWYSYARKLHHSTPLVRTSTLSRPSTNLLNKRLPKKRIIQRRQTIPISRPKKQTKKWQGFFRPFPFPLHVKKRAVYYQAQHKIEWKQKTFERLFLNKYHKEKKIESIRKAYLSPVVRMEALQYLHRRGVVNYRKLGFFLLAKVEPVLQQYLSMGGPMTKVPKGSSDIAKKALTLASILGHYPSLFKVMKVMKGTKSLTEEQWFWFRTFFFTRWAMNVFGQYPTKVLLGKTLYVDYLKMKICFGRKHKRRARFVKELVRYESSSPERIFGWLMIQHNEPLLAIGFLQRATRKDPKDAFSVKLLKHLQNIKK